MRRGRKVLDLDAIADAVLECIAETDVERTTTAAIASRLQVTPRALYHYVESREQMLRLAVRRWIVSAPTLGDGPLEAELDTYIELARDHFAKYSSITRIGLDEGVVDYHETFYAMQESNLERIASWGFDARESLLVFIELVRLCNALGQYYGPSDNPNDFGRDNDDIMARGLREVGHRYPLTAAAGVIPVDDQIASAKRLFIDGVRARLADARPSEQ